MRCGGWQAANDALGILTRFLAITGTMAICTISASPAFTAAATMAAASDPATPGHRSGRSGIAADWAGARYRGSSMCTDRESLIESLCRSDRIGTEALVLY